MKKRMFYLLGLSIIVCAGCLKSNDTYNQSSIPKGAFNGVFRIVHRNSTTHKLDTASANIILTMSTATGYQVTGDTTSLHAGSYGDFALNAYLIQFDDKTYNSSANSTTHPKPAKYHLQGQYIYFYNGSSFKFDQTYADTLSYQYDLIKK